MRHCGFGWLRPGSIAKTNPCPEGNVAPPSFVHPGICGASLFRSQPSDRQCEGSKIGVERTRTLATSPPPLPNPSPTRGEGLKGEAWLG